MDGRVVVGTSSWADPGFVLEWYPAELPARDRLAYYAERFEGVEVNSTWYAVPPASTVERWVDVTPGTFTFDIKLHRLLSRHAAQPESLPKELRSEVEVNPRGRVVLSAGLERALLDDTLRAVGPLIDAGRLSSFLLQLSPAFKPGAHELDELAATVEALAPHPVAIEFRHAAWTAEDRREDTFGWLERHHAAFVGVDAPQDGVPTLMPAIDAATHPGLAYLRAHGRNLEGWKSGRTVAERFGYEYDDAELEEIGDRATRLAGEVPVVRLQFNNNRGADAPRAARRMREILGQDPGAPAPGAEDRSETKAGARG
jgi:uncharacterized protein YecE (DUF72 family)